MKNFTKRKTRRLGASQLLITEGYNSGKADLDLTASRNQMNDLLVPYYVEE